MDRIRATRCCSPVLSLREHDLGDAGVETYSEADVPDLLHGASYWPRSEQAHYQGHRDMGLDGTAERENQHW